MARPLLPANGGDVGFWDVKLVAAINDVSDRADGRLPAFTRTATNYNVTAADIGTTIYRDLIVANAVVVPTGVGQPEDRLLVRQKGTGPTSIAAGSGMTLISVGKTAAPFTLAGQGAVVEIVFETSTRAYVDGAIA